AATVNDAALKNGVIQAAFAHDLLGGPFGFVIGRAAVWARPQETDEHNLPRAGLSGGIYHMTGAFDVDSRESLFPGFAVNTRAMDDHLATGESGDELLDIVQRQRDEVRSS